MDEATFEEHLKRRLQMIESPDGAAHLAGDLPMIDIIATVAALFVLTVALLWWAY